jgi:hypothetical protein
LLEALAEFRKGKHFFLPDNPTAENLGSYLLWKARELTHEDNFKVTMIVCHETPNCRAVAEI